MDALFEAIDGGDAEAVRRLVSADPTAAAARDAAGVSALMRARYRRADEIVALLVDAGPEPDVFEAAALGAEERLDELTAREPALVGVRSPDGFTPLHLAAYFCESAAARLLVERGADVAAVADNPLGVQPLHSAVAAGQREIAELLLDRGADPNARQALGATPLHAAATNGDAELVELLVARGADPAAAREDGQTPADRAEQAGHAELAGRLRG